MIVTSSYIIYAIYLSEIQKEPELDSFVNCSTENTTIFKTDIEERIMSSDTENNQNVLLRYIVSDNIYITVDKEYIENLLTLDNVAHFCIKQKCSIAMSLV